jgi:hypothetical protein
MEPREASLLTLVASNLRSGMSSEEALAPVETARLFVQEVARALTGDETVTPAAREAAVPIARWAGLTEPR